MVKKKPENAFEMDGKIFKNESRPLCLPKSPTALLLNDYRPVAAFPADGNEPGYLLRDQDSIHGSGRPHDARRALLMRDTAASGSETSITSFRYVSCTSSTMMVFSGWRTSQNTSPLS